ncbi:MAG: triose-phosphate isomerase [Candidatus Cloacimonetes bacterium]|nr:triose-phosphate isomerase [Candidatus Cloacimonadota bacterium]
MKRFIIAGNWKMHKTKEECDNFFDCLGILSDNVTKIICPSFPLITIAEKKGREKNIKIGAQNVSEHAQGAFTGEVSAEIIHSIGVQYCIIGHSERRQYFNETDDLIQKKWMQLRKLNINPIICIGETLEQRENGKTIEVIKSQINQIFYDVELVNTEDLIIAYEPVWAIGTGKTATPEMAQEVHGYIRNLLCEHYWEKANDIPILYGGSVKSSNIKDLLIQKDINGALVGGASLLSSEYELMVKYASELLSKTV